MSSTSEFRETKKKKIGVSQLLDSSLRVIISDIAIILIKKEYLKSDSKYIGSK